MPQQTRADIERVPSVAESAEPEDQAAAAAVAPAAATAAATPAQAMCDAEVWAAVKAEGLTLVPSSSNQKGFKGAWRVAASTPSLKQHVYMHAESSTHCGALGCTHRSRRFGYGSVAPYGGLHETENSDSRANLFDLSVHESS